MHSNRQNKWVRAPESRHLIPPKIRAAFPPLWESANPAPTARSKRPTLPPLPRRALPKKYGGTVIQSAAKDLSSLSSSRPGTPRKKRPLQITPSPMYFKLQATQLIARSSRVQT